MDQSFYTLHEARERPVRDDALHHWHRWSDRSRADPRGPHPMTTNFDDSAEPMQRGRLDDVTPTTRAFRSPGVLAHIDRSDRNELRDTDDSAQADVDKDAAAVRLENKRVPRNRSHEGVSRPGGLAREQVLHRHRIDGH